MQFFYIICLRPYDIWRTQSKDLHYVLNIYCKISTWTCLFLLLFSWYILQLRTWTRSHVVLADLDLTWIWLWLDTSVEIKLGYSLFKLSFLYRIFGKISTIAERGHCVTFYNLSWFSENIKPLEILSVKVSCKNRCVQVNQTPWFTR